jgi:hypothetical protein
MAEPGANYYRKIFILDYLSLWEGEVHVSGAFEMFLLAGKIFCFSCMLFILTCKEVLDGLATHCLHVRAGQFCLTKFSCIL